MLSSACWPYILFDLFLNREIRFFGLFAVASYLLALFSKEAAVFFCPFFCCMNSAGASAFLIPLHAALLAVSIYIGD